MASLRGLALAAVCLVATVSMGQDPVISSFRGNGQLSWSNAVNSNALYRVEWAAQPGGPWFRNFDNIGSIDGHSATGFTVSVPMFYRVVMTTNALPKHMVWVEGGDAELGQTGIETPVHTNWISGFWMDANEVTKSQWDDVAAWAAAKGYDINVSDGSAKTNTHPVISVTWYEAVKWCNARSEKEGLKPCYYIDPFHFNVYKTGTPAVSNDWVFWNSGGYRLPSEAEWEKAARGGRQRKLFPWGTDRIDHTWANYLADTNSHAYDVSQTQGYHPDYSGGGFPRTNPGGNFPANGYGLHDMAGNVYEWCWDWYKVYPAGYASDPRGPATGTLRIYRGGSYNDRANYARIAYRNGNFPSTSDTTVGFRCVRGP